MKNYKTGECFCDVCGAYLGNYLDGTDENGNGKSYHSLIRLKYCKTCKADVLRKQKRYIQRDYRKSQTAKKKVLEERVKLLKAENKALRIRLFGTENEEQHKALIDLLKA